MKLDTFYRSYYINNEQSSFLFLDHVVLQPIKEIFNAILKMESKNPIVFISYNWFKCQVCTGIIDMNVAIYFGTS